MKIRTFTAATTQAAMTLVRAELGDDAVIISIDETANGRGIIVRAAADETAHMVEPTPIHRSIEERLEAFLTARLRAPPTLVRHAA
jgi:flagellar biosynthesis GTPase FlhF